MNVGVGESAARGSEKVTCMDEISGAIPELPGGGVTEVTESVGPCGSCDPLGVVEAEAVRAK